MELSLFNLLLILLAGWIAGSLTARLGYPSVLGELLVGILLGPPLLGVLHGGEAIAVLAEIGILLMMLYVGMEVEPSELGRASWAGLLAALGGFITPFALAYFVVIQFGGTPMGATFVAIAAGVTSLTTKSRILVDLRLLDTRVAHVMMAGALVSDTLSLIVFAGVLGVLEAGTLELATVGVVTLKVLLFFGFTALIGLKVFPWLGRRLSEAGMTNRTFNFTLVLLLAVAFGEMAHLAGLHAILGAFIAGLFLRENVLGRSLSEDLMGAVREASIGFLAPIFFVTAGFEVSLDVFRADLWLFLSILGVATFGKILGTALFYVFSGNGWREGLTIGGGMNGRGAVEIIVAGIALEMGLISQEIFSILVFMAIFTTATVPFFLKWGTEWLRRRGELVRSSEERRGTVILGAGPTARALAKVLTGGRPVWLIDTNPFRCQAATAEGLSVVCGNALDERVLSEANASRADSLATLTSNTEVNALAARIARTVFFVPEVHIPDDGGHGTGHSSTVKHLEARTLFGDHVNVADWDHWISHAEVQEHTAPVTDEADPSAFLTRMRDAGDALPLALRRGDDVMPFHSGLEVRPGDSLVLLRRTLRSNPRDRFDELAARCPVVDLAEPLCAEAFFAEAAAALGERLGIGREEMQARLIDRERSGSTVLSPGLAIPHVLLEGSDRFEMLIARCRGGVRFPSSAEPVRAVFVLAGTPDQRTFHLRALSAIAQIVHHPDFEDEWEEAAPGDTHRLREIVLSAERRRF